MEDAPKELKKGKKYTIWQLYPYPTLYP